MSRLTDRRRAKADPILRRYRTQLHSTGKIEACELEIELRECLNLGYQGLKGIIEDLAKQKDYVYLAAYYMENSNAGAGVVNEFQDDLARLYGIKWYHSPERDKKRKLFWRKLKAQR